MTDDARYSYLVKISFSDGSGSEHTVTGTREQMGAWLAAKLPNSHDAVMTVRPIAAKVLS